MTSGVEEDDPWEFTLVWTKTPTGYMPYYTIKTAAKELKYTKAKYLCCDHKKAVDGKSRRVLFKTEEEVKKRLGGFKKLALWEIKPSMTLEAPPKYKIFNVGTKGLISGGALFGSPDWFAAPPTKYEPTSNMMADPDKVPYKVPDNRMVFVNPRKLEDETGYWNLTKVEVVAPM